MSAAEPVLEEIGLVELALPIWQLELVGDLELPFPFLLLFLLQLSPNGTPDPNPTIWNLLNKLLVKYMNH